MRRSSLLSVLAVFSLPAGCGSYPTDMAGTLERIEARHAIRVGVADAPGGHDAAMRSFLSRVAQATDARIEESEGSMERLLVELEAGGLDLVVAEVAADSPWGSDVTVIEPLATQPVGERELGLSAVVRNGENRWIALLEKQARDMKTGS